MFLAKVIRWQNGLVMAFDAEGKPMSDLQGRFNEQLTIVLKMFVNEHTQFFSGVWAQELKPITAKEFFERTDG